MSLLLCLCVATSAADHGKVLNQLLRRWCADGNKVKTNDSLGICRENWILMGFPRPSEIGVSLSCRLNQCVNDSNPILIDHK